MNSERADTQMPNNPDFPLRVFYDGSCYVCAAEIAHYMTLEHGGKLFAVDISDPFFDPEPLHIPREKFMHELHAIDRNGHVFRGVEAFWAIWQAFPAATVYGSMGSVITMPLVNPIARLLYKGFARIRPYLPKRHNCSSGTCRIGRKG